MVQHHHVHGYEGFLSLVKTIKATDRINVLFTGTKENGVSWCPDCVEGVYYIISKLPTYPLTINISLPRPSSRTVH